MRLDKAIRWTAVLLLCMALTAPIGGTAIPFPTEAPQGVDAAAMAADAPFPIVTELPQETEPPVRLGETGVVGTPVPIVPMEPIEPYEPTGLNLINTPVPAAPKTDGPGVLRAAWEYDMPDGLIHAREGFTVACGQYEVKVFVHTVYGGETVTDWEILSMNPGDAFALLTAYCDNGGDKSFSIRWPIGGAYQEIGVKIRDDLPPYLALASREYGPEDFAPGAELPIACLAYFHEPPPGPLSMTAALDTPDRIMLLLRISEDAP